MTIAPGVYYLSYRDHEGKRITKSAKTNDKATAQRIANDLEAKAALRREGLIDPTQESISNQSQRTIESHLADYENKLRTAQRTEKHIQSTLRFIRWISNFAQFTTAQDINADDVNRYATKLKNEDGLSARTIQSRLTAMKGFSKWLMEHHKLARDPLSSVKKPNPESDRRRQRRMLTPEEWYHLQAYLLTAGQVLGVNARERAILYELAIQTGLRAAELGSLRRRNLFLSESQPYITCEAASTKNRKEARQFIQPELALLLKDHISTKSPKANVFNLPHLTNLSRMLKADIEGARKEWLKSVQDIDERLRLEASDFLAQTDSEGEVLDFHSLRHTCGAWLAISGASPKVVQSIMRHSTITLTMDRYGHLLPGSEADAVAKLKTVFQSNK